MKQIFYLTFDGILDPLGKSQILPYLEKCKYNHNITIFSLEKKKKLKDNKKKYFYKGFNWKFQIFNESKNIIVKLFFYTKLFFKINNQLMGNNYEIIHCRGLLPGLFGYLFKSIYKKKIIFDMRSFWVDERIESLKNSKMKSYALTQKFLNILKKN